MKLKKGEKLAVSEHFSSSQFDCHCDNSFCTETLIDERLLQALEELLPLSGPFTITSGFRCGSYNAKVGGKPNSQHLYGKAVDIQSNSGLNGPELAGCANQVNEFCFGGMGIAATWIHIDVREGRARWTYG